MDPQATISSINDACSGRILATEALPQFRNAVPVIVVIVPVIGVDPLDGETKTGVLAIRRSIPPKIGELALPSGFLEHEDWQIGGLREVLEETCLDLLGEPKLKPLSIVSVEEGKRLLIFGESTMVHENDLPPFTPNAECGERVILYRAQKLAFPTHTEALANYLKN